MSETTMVRIGWILSGLFVLFMLGASVAPKFLGLQVADDTMRQLGWPVAFQSGDVTIYRIPSG